MTVAGKREEDLQYRQCATSIQTYPILYPREPPLNCVGRGKEGGGVTEIGRKKREGKGSLHHPRTSSSSPGVPVTFYQSICDEDWGEKRILGKKR